MTTFHTETAADRGQSEEDSGVTVFGPDFPFCYNRWLTHPAGIGEVPPQMQGQEVAVIGAGVAGAVAAYELAKVGLKPVVYEADRIGGRLRSESFEGAPDAIAEMGGMRFPRSSAALFHYADLLGLSSAPFPNPLTPAAGSTVIELGGERYYAEKLEDLPVLFNEVAEAWDAALEREFNLAGLQQAIREKDSRALKRIWDRIVPLWDDRSFYEFVSSSEEFSALSFRHREVFGQVGFGTGGWDSDFANSMLEILRVVVTECDSNQQLIVGGAEQIPRGLLSLQGIGAQQTRGAVTALRRKSPELIEVQEDSGELREYSAVLVTCQSWLLTTVIDCDESLFSQDLWMALDRTRYMQSSKTFVMTDRPFWKDKHAHSNQDLLSMTLTDRLTRGTYLFDNGPDSPGVICLTYSWMSDALKMLPYTPQQRADLALRALSRIYPDVDIGNHIIGEPLTISWESEKYFLGAFKGALPGHYRYNHRMYSHFMQHDLDPKERGIFLAGDDISFTPAWAEGAVQTALNAVWGIITHLGGGTHPENPGPGDVYHELGPIGLDE